MSSTTAGIQFARSWYWSRFFVIKICMYFYGFLYVIFSRDHVFTPSMEETIVTEDDDDPTSCVLAKKTKQIVFIRHAESRWNVLSRSIKSEMRDWKQKSVTQWLRTCLFLYQIILATILSEFKQLFTKSSDLLDSALSIEGVNQAHMLQSVLLESKLINGQHGSIRLIVTSNLSRCIETARIAFDQQEYHLHELNIVSDLQEIGRGIDTLSLDLSLFQDQIFKKDDDQQLFEPHSYVFDFELAINSSKNHGNKHLMEIAQARLYRFAKYVFEQKEDQLIIVGHSLWLHRFLQEFCSVDHEAMHKRIINCGVLSFDLVLDHSNVVIPSGSINLIYGDYQSDS